MRDRTGCPSLTAGPRGIRCDTRPIRGRHWVSGGGLASVGLSSPSAGRSSRAHKRVRWRKPPPGKKRRPGVIDTTRAELVRGLELRQGSLWMRISRAVIVAGYPIARALFRVRALRSDGAESLLAMAVALLYLADVRTGFVGKPRAGGGPWERFTLRDLAQLAFGAQTEADIRRARRAFEMMVSLGWAHPTKQVRRHAGVDATGADAFASEPAVRRLNLTRLCEMVGTAWLLKRDRQHADRVRGDGTASLGETRDRRQAAQGPQQGPAAASAGERRPPPPGDPPARSGRARVIAEIIDLLGKG